MTPQKEVMRHKRKTFSIDNYTEWGLPQVIAYMENTSEDSWGVGVVRSKDGKKDCLFGHLHRMGGGDEEGAGSNYMDFFEEIFATTYMVFPVNDGEHPDYQQETPKQRVLAYLRDLRDGKAKTTSELMVEV